MAAVIEISGLVKRFGRVTALDGVDLTVRPGQVHAFLGPNGAGKSTTIRCLLGILRPTAGSVRLFGRDAVDLHRRVAFVPGDVDLWGDFTGGEVIGLLTALAGLPAAFAVLYPGLFPTPADLEQLALTMSSPAMVALMGPVYGMERLTEASVMAQETLVWFLVAAAVMNVFLVNRHTRADEELGRLELIHALPVGRLTGAAAVMAFAVGLNLLIAASC